MTANGPDDNLERRLQDLLRSRRLSIDPASDTLDRIHAGARRRQHRHRIATSALSAVAVVAVVAIGIALRPTHPARTSVADGTHTGSPSGRGALNGTETTNSSPNSTDPHGPAPASASSAARSAPAIATIPAGGAPPSGFVPMSVTAVNAATFWVLGHAPCGSQTCTALAKTTDAGQSFTEMGAPPSALVPDVPGGNDVFGAGTISDVRFVDGNDGWAYGGALWQTTDGGRHWTAVDIGGSVEKLEVASGRAWAIVFAGAAASSGAGYEVYTTTYPGGSWAIADSAGTFGPAEPALAVQGNSAIVVGSDAVSGKLRAVVANGDASFAPAPGPAPCAGAPGQPLSPSSDSVWLVCAPGNGGGSGVFVSTDFGNSWQAVSSTVTPSSASVAIAAVDASSAIVSVGATLERLGSDGSIANVSQPSIGGSGAFSFVGFTTPAIGFAIPDVASGRQLWRSTDGGSHWSVVTF